MELRALVAANSAHPGSSLSKSNKMQSQSTGGNHQVNPGQLSDGSRAGVYIPHLSSDPYQESNYNQYNPNMPNSGLTDGMGHPAQLHSYSVMPQNAGEMPEDGAKNTEIAEDYSYRNYNPQRRSMSPQNRHPNINSAQHGYGEGGFNSMGGYSPLHQSQASHPSRGKQCSRNHDVVPNKRWKSRDSQEKSPEDHHMGHLQQNMDKMAVIRNVNQTNRHLVDIQAADSKINQMSKMQESLATVDNKDGDDSLQKGSRHDDISHPNATQQPDGPGEPRGTSGIKGAKNSADASQSSGILPMSDKVYDSVRRPTDQNAKTVLSGEKSIETAEFEKTDKLNSSTTHFQNNTLIQGLSNTGDISTNSRAPKASPSNQDDQNVSRNKRQVFSKDSQNNKLNLTQKYVGVHAEPDPILSDQRLIENIQDQSQTDGQGIEGADQQQIEFVKGNEGTEDTINFMVPGTTFAYSGHQDRDQALNEDFEYLTNGIRMNQIQENLEYLEKQAKLNPNFKLDHTSVINPALIEILENQKDMIQKDGNIYYNGVVIKGIPLRAKFNPNFRDPHHGPPGKRPQSRGLTQGNIIQLASKVLNQISSPKSAGNDRGGLVHGLQQRTRSFDRPGIILHHSMEPRKNQTIKNALGSKSAWLMAQGTKKHAITKKMPERAQDPKINTNNDIAMSMKSMSSHQTKNDANIVAERKMTKIQGGGDKGQDKVKLNVKFKKRPPRGRGDVFQQSQGNYSSMSPTRPPKSLYKFKNNINVNESLTVSQGDQNEPQLSDKRESANQKLELEVCGSQSPSPELRHYRSPHKPKEIRMVSPKGSEVEDEKNQRLTMVSQNQSVSSANERTRVIEKIQITGNNLKIGSIQPRSLSKGNITGTRQGGMGAPVMTELLNLDDKNQGEMQQRSQAVELPPSQFYEDSTNAQQMRLDLNKLQSDDAQSRNRSHLNRTNLISTKSNRSENNPVGGEDAEPTPGHVIENQLKQFEQLSQHQNREEHQLEKIVKQNQQAPQTHKIQVARKQGNSKFGNISSYNAASTPHHNQIRKGHPYKDFMKQVDRLEQGDFIDKGTLAAISATNSPQMALSQFGYVAQGASNNTRSRGSTVPRIQLEHHRGKQPENAMSADLKVMSLSKVDRKEFEQSFGAGPGQGSLSKQEAGVTVTRGMYKGNNQSGGQHYEIVSSSCQIKECKSDDKVKTEKMENTVSQRDSGRNNAHMTESNQIELQEINERCKQLIKPSQKKMVTARLNSNTENNLLKQTKRSMPISHRKGASPEQDPPLNLVKSSLVLKQKQNQSNVGLGDSQTQLAAQKKTNNNTQKSETNKEAISATQKNQANHSSKRVILSTNRRSNSTNQVNVTPNPHASTFMQNTIQNVQALNEPDQSDIHRQSKAVIIEVVENRNNQTEAAHNKMSTAKNQNGNLEVDNKNAIIEINYGPPNEKGDDRSEQTTLGKHLENTDRDQVGDHGDVDMMMKPKGINIFQFDIMKSENDSIVFKDAMAEKNHAASQSKEIINIEVQNQVDGQDLQVILNSNQIDEYVTEENRTDNQQHFKTGEGSIIEPKTSFCFTSSQMKEEESSQMKEANMIPDVVIESQIDGATPTESDPREKHPPQSGLNELTQKNLVMKTNDKNAIKKMNTVKPKQRRPSQKRTPYMPSNDGHRQTNKNKAPTVDITNQQYTEKSSNANSLDKSEFIKDLDQTNKDRRATMKNSEINESKMKSKFHNDLSSQDDKSIPLNNKDVIARSKQMKQGRFKKSDKAKAELRQQLHDITHSTLENKQINVSLRDHNLTENLSNTDKNESIHRLSENKQRQIKNNGIDTALMVNHEERKAVSKIAQKMRKSSRHSPVLKDRAEELNVEGKNILKSMIQVEMKTEHTQANRDNLKSSARYQKSNRENAREAGDVGSKSRQMSKIISESMLDCRDIGTGTMAIHEDEIDQFLKNSSEILGAAISDGINVLGEDTEQNKYKSIPTTNLQLDDKLDDKSKKSVNNISNKRSSVYERNSKQYSDNDESPKNASGRIFKKHKSSTFRTNVMSDSQYANDDYNTLSSQQIQNLIASRSQLYRPKQLYDYLQTQRRIIVKSPNPNDAKKIRIGDTIELEADTLLNGRIFTDSYKKKAVKGGVSPQEKKALKSTQFNKQKKLNTFDDQKDFQLCGAHIDADKAEVKATFEQVNPKTLQDIHYAQLRKQFSSSEKSRVDLQNQLVHMSLEQLQNIQALLCQGCQIVKTTDIPNLTSVSPGTIESLSNVSPKSLANTSYQKTLQLDKIDKQLTQLSDSQSKMKIIDQVQQKFIAQQQLMDQIAEANQDTNASQISQVSQILNSKQMNEADTPQQMQETIKISQRQPVSGGDQRVIHVYPREQQQVSDLGYKTEYAPQRSQDRGQINQDPNNQSLDQPVTGAQVTGATHESRNATPRQYAQYGQYVPQKMAQETGQNPTQKTQGTGISNQHLVQKTQTAQLMTGSYNFKESNYNKVRGQNVSVFGLSSPDGQGIMVLEDDHDKQTEYLSPSKKGAAQGAGQGNPQTKINLSQMSSFRLANHLTIGQIEGNQKISDLIASSTFQRSNLNDLKQDSLTDQRTKEEEMEINFENNLNNIQIKNTMMCPKKNTIQTSAKGQRGNALGAQPRVLTAAESKREMEQLINQQQSFGNIVGFEGHQAPSQGAENIFKSSRPIDPNAKPMVDNFRVQNANIARSNLPSDYQSGTHPQSTVSRNDTLLKNKIDPKSYSGGTSVNIEYQDQVQSFIGIPNQFIEQETSPLPIDTNRLSTNPDLKTDKRDTITGHNASPKPLQNTDTPWATQQVLLLRAQEKKKMNEDLKLSQQNIQNIQQQQRLGSQTSAEKQDAALLGIRVKQQTLYQLHRNSLTGGGDQQVGEISPNIEVLKSFTPMTMNRNNASPLGNNVQYNKVQQLAADIKVSRKSQPLVDTSNTMGGQDYGGHQKLRLSQAQLLMNQTICSNTKRDSSTIGGATMLTMQQAQAQNLAGVQKLGKKIYHQDRAHYELYMQFQQMKQLGESMQQNHSLDTSQMRQPQLTDHRRAALRNARKNTFFNQVSKKLGGAFSPKSGKKEPSGSGVLGEAQSLQKLNEAMSGPLSTNNKENKTGSKQHIGSRAGGRLRSPGHDGDTLNMSERNMSNMNNIDSNAQMRKDNGYSSGGLYQQSFQPACRMIQKQKFLRHYEDLQKKKHKHMLNVMTPPGLRAPMANDLHQNIMNQLKLHGNIHPVDADGHSTVIVSKTPQITTQLAVRSNDQSNAQENLGNSDYNDKTDDERGHLEAQTSMTNIREASLSRQQAGEQSRSKEHTRQRRNEAFGNEYLNTLNKTTPLDNLNDQSPMPSCLQPRPIGGNNLDISDLSPECQDPAIKSEAHLQDMSAETHQQRTDLSGHGGQQYGGVKHHKGELRKNSGNMTIKTMQGSKSNSHSNSNNRSSVKIIINKNNSHNNRMKIQEKSDDYSLLGQMVKQHRLSKQDKQNLNPASGMGLAPQHYHEEMLYDPSQRDIYKKKAVRLKNQLQRPNNADFDFSAGQNRLLNLHESMHDKSNAFATTMFNKGDPFATCFSSNGERDDYEKPPYLTAANIPASKVLQTVQNDTLLSGVTSQNGQNQSQSNKSAHNISIKLSNYNRKGGRITAAILNGQQEGAGPKGTHHHARGHQRRNTTVDHTKMPKSKSNRVGGIWGSQFGPGQSLSSKQSRSQIRSPAIISQEAQRSGMENRNMLYSVKNHQLYHSQRMQAVRASAHPDNKLSSSVLSGDKKELEQGNHDSQMRSPKAASIANNYLKRRNQAANYQTIDAAPGQGIFGDRRVQQIVASNQRQRQMVTGNAESGPGNWHQYSQYRRIMTADNAGVGGNPNLSSTEAGKRNRRGLLATQDTQHGETLSGWGGVLETGGLGLGPVSPPAVQEQDAAVFQKLQDQVISVDKSRTVELKYEKLRDIDKRAIEMFQ